VLHAHGDDFVVVDRRGQDDPITPEVARRLGNRSTGIGFDQLAVILDCNDAEARLVFWNPDGSPLNACGSATRGVADILMRERGTRSVSLRTNRGLLDHAVEVVCDGGAVEIRWDGVGSVYLIGTVETVFSGTVVA
jgi:diaminopimelate epimerase